MGAEPLRLDRLAEPARLVLDLRLLAVVVTLAALPGRPGEARWLVVVLLLATVPSFVLLRWWHRLGPAVMRHPLWLVAELALAAVVLAVAGPDGPFLWFTLSTALLAGLLYGPLGGALFAGLLIAAHLWALDVRSAAVGVVDDFQALVTTPAMYGAAALAGALLRRLLDRQAEATYEAAAADERARLAREMHDSLAKTLHGIALSATALERWVARQPAEAADRARDLARAAETAAVEARALIVDLREERLEGPLHAAVARRAEVWARRTGVAVVLDVVPVDVSSARGRYELLRVLDEALANVERHAGARRVHVRLDATGLVVTDDGWGFEPEPVDGRFGLVGMRERAERAGGRLEVESAPGNGTTVRVVLAPVESRIST